MLSKGPVGAGKKLFEKIPYIHARWRSVPKWEHWAETVYKKREYIVFKHHQKGEGPILRVNLQHTKLYTDYKANNSILRHTVQMFSEAR